ncbi:MAG: enoyl-CoA hydratase/isomerase family protein [Proteobacteria bacterium]|nr:enoyl-CoA hydratase/isomerase family protein [Pseudomonadota bacterium]
MPDLNLSVKDGIARLQLNRPAVFNALSPGLLQELIDKCDQLARDDTTKVVVLEGSGKHFCAGADLPQFTKRMQTDPHGTADIGRRTAEALAGIPQITIAAIKGYCIGGALVLSAACDLRIAADNSRFSIPELDAGIPLSWGGMAHIVRLIGESLANDLVLTCRRFGADDALRAGFISQIVAAGEFEEEVTTLAESVAAKPRIVLRQTKRKLIDIRAGTFDARDDAAEMIAAMADPEAMSIGQEYIRKNIGK